MRSDIKNKMNSRKKLGDIGENIACKDLLEKGHTILERNYRYSHLEIDLITLSENGIHFVEIKSRTAPLYDNPQNSVNYRKQQNIIKAAKHFLSTSQIINLSNIDDIHFDIFTIIFDGFNIETKYIENAYFPMYI